MSALRQSRAHATPDDGPTFPHHLVKVAHELRARMFAHVLTPDNFEEVRHQGVGKRGVIDRERGLISRRCDVCRMYSDEAAKKCSVGCALEKRLPSKSIAESPFSGVRKRTGPSLALSLAAIHSRIRRFSSDVVRFESLSMQTYR